MPRRRIPISKPVAAVLLLFFAWWLTPAVLKSLLRTSFWEFQAPAWTTLGKLEDLRDYWSLRMNGKNDLIEAGVEIARLNAYYSLRLQEMEAKLEEIDRLENLLDLPSHPRFRYEPARIIQRDTNAWWQQIVIRKGSSAGVFEGAAVVYAGGVVGRVREVHKYTAVVDLITSPNFRMAAHFEGDQRPITFQGGLNPTWANPTGRVNNVPPDLTASEEDPRRVTSSALGGLFPDGFTVGWVTGLEPGSDGLFQSGSVQLDERLLSLREVAVLIPLDHELENTEESSRP